jgi:hypothetical protein
MRKDEAEFAAGRFLALDEFLREMGNRRRRAGDGQVGDLPYLAQNKLGADLLVLCRTKVLGLIGRITT